MHQICHYLRSKPLQNSGNKLQHSHISMIWLLAFWLRTPLLPVALSPVSLRYASLRYAFLRLLHRSGNTLLRERRSDLPVAPSPRLRTSVFLRYAFLRLLRDFGVSVRLSSRRSLSRTLRKHATQGAALRSSVFGLPSSDSCPLLPAPCSENV